MGLGKGVWGNNSLAIVGKRERRPFRGKEGGKQKAFQKPFLMLTRGLLVLGGDL